MSVWLTVLPETWLHTRAFALASTFVGINTMIYVALAVVKLLPVLNPGRWWSSRRRRHRREVRSIYHGAQPPQ